MLLAACGGDDTDDPGAATDPGGSMALEDLAEDTDNALITVAVEGYRGYVQTQIAELQAEVEAFADAVRAGDVAAAQAAYPASRRPWERIEPIAGLIEDIDGAVDAREDDFDGPEDAAFTGWHKLEWYLWEQPGEIADAAPFADRLEADLQTLADSAGTLELPPGVLTVGAQELIEEVASPDGKLSGEEDRYSGTDLYDFQANVEGSQALVELLRPALEEADAELLGTIDGLFTELNGQLAELGSFEEGYPHYSEVTDAQKTQFSATLGELAESLSLLNGTLGLD